MTCMSKPQLSVLACVVLVACYAPMANADLREQCLAQVPHFKGTPVTGDPNRLPVYVEADEASVSGKTKATYRGNVQVRQGNRYLSAKEANFYQVGGKADIQREVQVTGGFDYQDNLIQMLGKRATIGLGEQSADISDAWYQLVGRQGNGTAEQIEVRPDYRLLRDATFSTCLPNEAAWSIVATEMRQYVKEEYAEMWNARFRIAGVPVFYTPYLQFPLGDRRRSGLLMPTYGHGGRDGYWYSQPFYWNIAPNMDATIWAKYMSQRGWQGVGEYRLLSPLGNTTLAGEYMKRDRDEKFAYKDNSRHLLYLKHEANPVYDWRLRIDYTKVSDPTYFDDFQSQYGQSTDGYANQEVSLQYNQPNYNISLSALQFQIFDTAHNTPYKTLPRLDYNYYMDSLTPWLDFHWYSQVVHFKNDDKNLPSVWRAFGQPTFTVPLSNRYGSVKFENSLLLTRYWQKAGKGDNALPVKSTVNRVMPQFKVDVSTLLAKDYANGITQTIEPSVGYLYRPYRDQSDIGGKFGYDSSSDYNGIDRILSANQLRAGLTSRFYDNTGVERFNAGLEQTYYLADARAVANEVKATKGSTDWKAFANYAINNEWNLAMDYHFDAEYKRASSANVAVQYRPEPDHLVQLAYRYINRNELPGYNKDIKQLGLTAAWTVGNHWALVGKYYHDFALKKPVDQFFGLQYSNCCWTVSLGVNRYVEQRADQQPNEVLYDHNIGIRVELGGFNNTHKTGVDRLLEQGKIPYTQPFSL